MAEPPKPSQTPLPQEENKIENETPPPPVEKIISPDLDYESLLKKYEKKEDFLVNENWKLSIVYDIFKKENFIMKEYTNEFKNIINNFYEISKFEGINLRNCSSKYIIKLIDYCNDYVNEKNFQIFIFENFDKTLDKLLKEKKTLKVEEIRNILIKLNEGIKHLENNKINNIIISPENIGIIENKDNSYSIKLLDLFPYYELKEKLLFDKNIQMKAFNYLSPELPDTYTPGKDEEINTLNSYTKSILWNIGLLIYELYFGELPSLDLKNKEKVINVLKKSGEPLLDDLLSKLLIKEVNLRIKWDDYVNHEFFNVMPVKENIKILYDKEVNQDTQELHLLSEEVDENNLKKLSKLNLNNLLHLNLSSNLIKDMSVFNKESFKQLKILNIEKNKIRNLDNLENESLKSVEVLFLSSNSFSDIKSFKNKNFENLRYLSLSKNNIEDISYLRIANLSNLTILNLSFNNIKEIDFLDKINIPYLKELYLNNNHIKKIDVLENIIFQNLEILNLESNQIIDINVFYKVKFQEKLKELNLANNPIKEYNYLNFCYFQNLKNIFFNLNNLEFILLSIKIKLFGYEFEKGDDPDNMESVLFVPFELFKTSSINTNQVNYKNSFKIITNKNYNFENLKKYFIEKILEIDYKLVEEENLIIIHKKDLDKNSYNHKIYTYYVIVNQLNPEIKKNTFSLIKENKNLHEISGKYNRIPNFLEEKENNYYLNINCQFKKKNLNYYNNAFVDQIIDNNQILSVFLKNNYYYNSFPIIFINSKYYEQFLDFLKKCPKYEKFNYMENLNIKLILSSEKNYKYQHLTNNNNISLISDVIENIDFYKTEEIIVAINKIKNSIKGDYIQNINEWVMIIMDILVEFFLFILNQKPYYYLCPHCQNPILYTYIIKNLNNNIIINDKSSFLSNSGPILFSEFIKEDFDNTIYKSFKICNSLNNFLFSNNIEKHPIIDYKRKYENFNLKKNIHIPANPPKKNEGSINIIYHDENYKIFQESINSDARRFKEACNGTFIFSNSMEVFETIIKEIHLKNSIKNINKFLLITTGSTFKKVVDFLNSNKYSGLISKACIYCMRKEKYLPLMKDYEILGGVFHIPSDVVNFIKNNCIENNVIFDFSKLVTYENYTSKYNELHKIISKYYSKINLNSFNFAIDLIRDILNKNNIKAQELYKILETFQSDDYEIIKQYTENFYYYVNKWLLNLDNLVYEKFGCLIGGLMFKLNEYGIKNDKGIKENCILYRGMYINYLDALSFQIHKGKIISFQTFISTSIKEKTGIFFSKKERKTLEERKNNCMFSTLIKINYNWNKDLFPLCFDIKELSKYTTEEEYLFHPFSFFKINEFKIDLSNNILELTLETIGKKEILENKINDGKKIILNESENIIEIKN